jgi:hypothetical protein
MTHIPQTVSGKALFIRERLNTKLGQKADIAFNAYRSLKMARNLQLGIAHGLDSNPLERLEATEYIERLDLDIMATGIYLNLILDKILDHERYELALKN